MSVDKDRWVEPTDEQTVEVFYGSRRAHEDSPERRLMIAVLEDALYTLQQSGVADRRSDPNEARRWFAATGRCRWPYTFENICACLGLSASAIRRELGIGVGLKAVNPW